MKRHGMPAPQARAMAAIGVVCAVAAIIALSFPARARIYPLTVAIAAMLLVGLSWFLENRAADGPEDVGEPLPVGAALPYVGAMIGYVALSAVFGLVTASGVLVAAALGGHARIGWFRAVIAGALVAAGLMGLSWWLNLRWPPALLDLAALTGFL